jgi:vancomycin resistance protein YoaR
MYVQNYPNQVKHNRLTISIPGILAGFLLAFLAGAIILGIGFSLSYSSKIFPGVAVSGIDLGSLTLGEALQSLSGQVQFPNSGKIILTDGSNSWIATPTQLGFSPDLQTSLLSAYQYGRTGSVVTQILDQIRARTIGTNLSLHMVNNQAVAQAFLQQIASEVDRPVKEASIQINGLDVAVEPGQIGRTLDVDQTMLLIQKQLEAQQDGIVPVVVQETQPGIIDLSAQANQVKKIVSQPLILRMPDGDTSGVGPWSIGQADLANLLVFTQVTENSKNNVSIQVNQEKLNAYLENLVPVINQQSADARFTFNDETRQLDLIDHAKIGRSIDLAESVKSITQKLLNGEHQVSLSVNIVQPAVTDSATAKSLEITELLHQEVSYFYGSNASRVNNIRTAAGRFHGLLLAPGATLSMSDTLGDVSLNNGYSEALIILGHETIKGVGGGVCQVSTTLFRAAFFSGFPIIERHAHAYRVGYYEQTASDNNDPSLAGLDATVFVPVVDMKFKNDSPYWLLMETYVTDTSITWKFYSKSDGRTVDWKTTGPQNIVPAPASKYTENPDLAEGEIKQMDYSADGADISVDRTVYKDGNVIFQDNFQTHYMPWQAVFEYGPGTKIPNKGK